LRGHDSREHRVEGLYTLGTEALARLPDQAIVPLYRAGHLAAAAIISSSLAQLERLRQLHNASSDGLIAHIRVAIDE
jgi:hypothetical protein